MKVFITGATGWIGAAVTTELIEAGHSVTGLARSDSSVDTLTALGAEAYRGHLDDLPTLRRAAEKSDAVIHLANKHDFAHPEISNAAERSAVETIGEALAGSHRRFLLASGAPGGLGRVANENDVSAHHGIASMRGGSENRALEFLEKGVGVTGIRFAPTVHGFGDHGFISTIVSIARDSGVSAYIGDGENLWPAVHRSDAAHLVRLGLESTKPPTILHAMAEEGVPTREIAAAIGRGLGLPTVSIDPSDAGEHFGWIGRFFALDLPVSSSLTRQSLAWSPTGPTLLEDIASGAYFAV